MTTQEVIDRIERNKALITETMQAHPEVSSITMKIRDIPIDIIKQLASERGAKLISPTELSKHYWFPIFVDQGGYIHVESVPVQVKYEPVC